MGLVKSKIAFLSILLLSVPVSGAAKTTISFVTPHAAGEYSAFIQEFERRYPNIRISLTASSLGDRIYAQIAAGSAPDVFYLRGTDAQAYIATGILEPLDKYIKASRVDLKDFTPQSLVPYRDKKGTLFALPYDWCPMVAMYNISHLQAAGIPRLNADTTYDDLYDYTKKLTQFNGTSVKRFGLMTWVGNWGFEGQWLKPFGARLFNDDETTVKVTEPQAIQALAFIQKLYLTKGVGGEFPKKASIYIDGSWTFAGFLKSTEKWDIAPLPKGPAEQAGSAMGSSFAISRGSKRKAEAWVFLNELMGPLGMEMVWSKMSTPSRRSASKWYVERYKALDQNALNQAFNFSIAGRPLQPPGELAIVNVLNPLLGKLVDNKLSPEQTAQSLKMNIEALWKSRRHRK